MRIEQNVIREIVARIDIGSFIGSYVALHKRGKDLVERMTCVSVRETVPDKALDSAEVIQFIDIAPEALRKRMRHGNIYAKEKVETALANFFNKSFQFYGRKIVIKTFNGQGSLANELLGYGQAQAEADATLGQLTDGLAPEEAAVVLAIFANRTAARLHTLSRAEAAARKALESTQPSLLIKAN